MAFAPALVLQAMIGIKPSPGERYLASIMIHKLIAAYGVHAANHTSKSVVTIFDSFSSIKSCIRYEVYIDMIEFIRVNNMNKRFETIEY